MICGKETHFSHAMSIYRGLYFCTKCGNYAHVKLRNLAQPCTELKHHGKVSRDYIQAGKLPPGLSQWPEVLNIQQEDVNTINTVIDSVQSSAGASSSNAAPLVQSSDEEPEGGDSNTELPDSGSDSD